jgi:cell division protein FtsI (penicillin-binding protein 3)
MSNTKRDIKIRVYVAFIVMVGFGLAIMGRAIALQVVSGNSLRQLSKDQNTRINTLEPERGNIYTEDGSILSITLPEFTVHMDYGAISKDTFNKYAQPLSVELAKLFPDKSAAAFLHDMQDGFAKKSRYHLLRSHVQYNDYMAMCKMPILKMGANKGGFIAESNVKRINPFGLLANRTVGIYRKNAQKVGLEGKYDEFLAGDEGQRIEQKIAGGVWMPIDGSEVESKNGMDIITTIDVNVQDIAENALLSALTEHGATYGTAIVMETKTGKIKAMANLGRQPDGSYFEDYNYAIRPVEPGSTFKLLSLMSAIDDGLVKLDDKINATGGVAYFGKQRMVDAHRGLGTITIKEAFAKSSNVACARLIYNNYFNSPAKYFSHLQAMQINNPTGIDLAGEQAPVFSMGNTLRAKNSASLAWLAIGYEAKVSPLRTCMVYNTIANGGKMMKPYIVSEIREYGKTIQAYEPRIVAQDVCKPSTIEALKEAAFAVVEEGTGKALKNDQYTVCGKTGTAQVADKGISYKDGVYHASFVGFFPKEDPLYTICVLVRTAKGSKAYYGGQIALPVFKTIADRLYANAIHYHTPIQQMKDTSATAMTISGTTAAKLYCINRNLNVMRNVPTNTTWLTSPWLDSSKGLQYTALQAATNTVPNVSGMGLRDAIRLLEQSGMRVVCSGKGRVTSQSKVAGEIFEKGDIIKLQLG